MEKNNPQRKRATWTKWVVIGLLLIATVLDFTTFVLKPQFWNFDMSPLVVMTKNIFIITIVKFGVVGGLVYMLLIKKTNDYFRFLWIMCAIYLILFQIVGAINNRQVAELNPPIEQAPSVEVRVKTGINFSLIWGYYPILFSMLSFWLWNFGWRER